MYIQGSGFSDLQNRIHQFISGGPSYTSDLASYQSEASGYASSVSGYLVNAWIREFDHKQQQFSTGFQSFNG